MKRDNCICDLSKEKPDGFVLDLVLGDYFPIKDIKEVPPKKKEEKPKNPT